MSAGMQAVVRVLAMACCVVACVASTAQARPVAFWPLDEGKGEVARDLSGNWNDGIVRGAKWCEGKVGAGLRFGGAGSDNYVEVPDSETLELNSAFTIQFWWQKESGGVQIFFRKGRQSKRYNYYAYLEGDLHFTVTDSDGENYGVSAAAPPNGWHHMGFVYDGQSLMICVDGQVAAASDIGQVTLFTDDSSLLIGTYSPGYKYPLGGVLDEFLISDEGLRPDRFQKEVAQARSLERREVSVETFEPAQGALVLAKDSKPGATIVIRKGASRLQLDPALELRRYIEKITGARLPIRDDGEEVTGNLILVGESRRTEEMGLPGVAPKGDSFVIKATPGRLILLGNDQVMAGNEGFAFIPGKCKWGTSNAVHAFLHDYCGVRWFMPGKLGEVVPHEAALEVPEIDAQEQPFRTYALGSLWRDGCNSWSRRNLLGSSVFIHHSGGHLWYSLIPEKRYFAEHPDWFALRDGRRMGEGNHLCTSNKEMFAAALANLRAIYDQGYEWVELGQTDGYQRCRCAACEAMDEYRDPSGYWVPGRPADRIHLFHAALAGGIRESHPDRKVLIIAYGPTGEVPRMLDHFGDNVVVEFTHDPPELLARWSKFHNRFTAYVYWFGLYQRIGYGPKSSPWRVASEVRRLKAAGAEAFYLCGGGECWGTEAPSYYLVSQLLRNPELDEQEVLHEFCTGLFGEAGDSMEEFFRAFLSSADDYRQLGSIEVKPGVPYRGKSRTPAEVYLHSFDEDTMKRSQSFLESAMAHAPNETARRRVRFFHDGFEYVRLTWLALQHAEEWEREKSDETWATLVATTKEREYFVKELLARQAGNGGDLPPVFDASLEQLLYGPRGEYRSLFEKATGTDEEEG